MASGTIKSVVPRSDIVDNLTTNDSTKVLSAAQGYALNGNFNKNTFTAPPMNSDYTLLGGGYIKIGKIVFVHMVIKATGGAYTIATNLPQPKIANENTGRGAFLPNNINKNITVNSNAALYIGESLPTNTEFIVTGTYICV